MGSLLANPTVFVVEKRYEIALCANCNGLFVVKINDKDYYEKNSGVLSTEKNHVLISVPQEELNKAKHYSVLFFKSIDRKDHYAEFLEPECYQYKFKPLLKNDNINIYHLADIHKLYENGLKIVDYFESDIDLFISNGDIAEVITEGDYINSLIFHGEFSKGEIPVIFARGNHDTRGNLAEKFTEYFPSVNGKLFYSFSIGNIKGIVLDLGEDKVDSHEEYGGVTYEGIRYSTNNFHKYRLEELDFLKDLLANNERVDFVISHINPIQTTVNKGDIFDIERDLYKEYIDILEKLKVKFILTGHIHRAYIIAPYGEAQTLKSSIPSVVASYKCGDELWGGALTLKKDKLEILMTNEKHEIMMKEEIIF